MALFRDISILCWVEEPELGGAVHNGYCILFEEETCSCKDISKSTNIIVRERPIVSWVIDWFGLLHSERLVSFMREIE